MTELYNNIAPQTVNEPRTKTRLSCISLKKIYEKITTKMMLTADAKLLNKLSKYFITSDINMPPGMNYKDLWQFAKLDLQQIDSNGLFGN